MPTTLQQPVPDAPQDTTDQTQPCLSQQVEALLLTAERAQSTTRLAGTLNVPGKDVEAVIEQLNESYEASGRVMRIMRVAGGWRVQTTPDVSEVLQEAASRRTQHKLSQAGLETLSVIAYRQPVMRAEIEAIRGVACGEVLRGLMERRLIRIAGRAEELGRPMLYGTTGDFLRIFGLGSIDDLPDVEGMPRERVRREPAPSDESTAETPDGDDADAPAPEQPADDTHADVQADG